mmetsp:Transcript_28586/g.84189  ORF Transcript_28586/g.84189 Transcript_28586/m.84189 type:complete len:304 (+) Transcript_28586:611-1522(+)
MSLPLLIDQNLGSLGEAVVILGGHPRAVRAAAVHHHHIPDLGLSQFSLRERLRFAVLGRHEIAALAAVSHDHHALGIGAYFVVESRSGKDGDGMDGAIQRGTEDVRHARVELEEGVGTFPLGRDLILNGRYEGAGHGDEVRPRLDLELELPPSVLLGKVTELVGDGCADLLQVRGGLPRIPSDLVPSPKVERGDGIEHLAERQRSQRDTLPYLGIGPGTDVGVYPFDSQSVLIDDGRDGTVRHVFVPYPEGRRRSSDVGLGESRGRLAESSRSDSRVDPDPDLLAGAGEVLTESLELRDGARV